MPQQFKGDNPQQFSRTKRVSDVGKQSLGHSKPPLDVRKQLSKEAEAKEAKPNRELLARAAEARRNNEIIEKTQNTQESSEFKDINPVKEKKVRFAPDTELTQVKFFDKDKRISEEKNLDNGSNHSQMGYDSRRHSTDASQPTDRQQN